jgi:hypothetical protein
MFLTTNLGRTFEKAICLLYDTPYYGDKKFYDLEQAEYLKERTSKLKEIYPFVTHNNNYLSKYDFILKNSNEKFLSAKTTKSRGKVCPQVIGQCSKKNFYKYFNLDCSYNIKNYIQNNKETLLSRYFEYTFLCPVLYYNEKEDELLLINKRQDILWKKYDFEFSHIQYNKEWNGSTTLYMIDEFTEKDISIGEFQIHNNRDSIKFRWYFDNILHLFPEKFNIISL